MKRNRLQLAALVILTGSLCGTTPGLADKEHGKAIQDALDKVNARCPDEYPDDVRALPEADEFSEKNTDELMQMLQSWNPSLRVATAGELGRRGDEAMPKLMKGINSANWMVRAGAAQAMAAIVKQKTRGWQQAYPDIKDLGVAREKIQKEHGAQSDAFIRLAKDPRLEVRVAALTGLAELAPQTTAATGAVLRLCLDEDPYLAQDAMINLEKKFSASAIQQDQVITTLKGALNTPLPRGKGHVLMLVSRMNEESQRKFVPDLLQHLDWQPNRDTMFGAGGQELALRILTRLQVVELVPRLPKLMTKTMRGPGLFEPCLESAEAFGKDAKVILPELQQMLKDTEPTPAELKGRQGPDLAKRHNKLKDTVDFLEAQ